MGIGGVVVLGLLIGKYVILPLAGLALASWAVTRWVRRR